MAEYTTDAGAGGHAPYNVYRNAPPPESNTLTLLTNLTGAVVSLALIVGIGVWGYKLFMRDVSGIPVVQAVQGDMRVRPENPGGQLAQHQGLSVNKVAAEGSASAPSDTLHLAPDPMVLADDDQPVEVVVIETVASAPQQDTKAPEVTEDATANRLEDDVDAIVAQLTGAAPIEVMDDAQTILASVAVAEVIEEPVASPVAGLRASLRPSLRPVSASTVIAARAVPIVASTSDVDPESIPAGTRLVQLGAFDTPEVARDQWARLAGRFGDYLDGKQRVVQEAQSGGRTFYRLRAMGFADIGEARRFCSALVAENADCIPVVTR